MDVENSQYSCKEIYKMIKFYLKMSNLLKKPEIMGKRSTQRNAIKKGNGRVARNCLPAYKNQRKVRICLKKTKKIREEIYSEESKFNII